MKYKNTNTHKQVSKKALSRLRVYSINSNFIKMKKENLEESPKPLVISIEGEMYEWNKQYITGAEIKQLAGIAMDKELYLSLSDPWDDELIENEKKINLARPGIESFLIRKSLHFTIDGKEFKWYKQYINGKQVKQLGDIDDDDELYLKMPEGYEDELIGDSLEVDLARSGKENFISIKPKSFKIIVNGMLKEWNNILITYEEVVLLALGNVNYNTQVYTVSYSKGPKQNPKGTMVKGDTVFVKTKMNFNVAATDRA